ncbi:hypothetical protein PYW08_016283 [Mythimna loreyi]|uniref:Uncharacterized protein n=1 Tax=Mythimna loreyi TaxID=667449 RepID=A0ACC2QZ96_9NEOP|nr:hypothetical protein PYW08_016283 [Mythimna loreyi]
MGSSPSDRLIRPSPSRQRRAPFPRASRSCQQTAGALQGRSLLEPRGWWKTVTSTPGIRQGRYGVGFLVSKSLTLLPTLPKSGIRHRMIFGHHKKNCPFLKVKLNEGK